MKKRWNEKNKRKEVLNTFIQQNNYGTESSPFIQNGPVFPMLKDRK